VVATVKDGQFWKELVALSSTLAHVWSVLFEVTFGSMTLYENCGRIKQKVESLAFFLYTRRCESFTIPISKQRRKQTSSSATRFLHGIDRSTFDIVVLNRFKSKMDEFQMITLVG